MVVGATKNMVARALRFSFVFSEALRCSLCIHDYTHQNWNSFHVPFSWSINEFQIIKMFKTVKIVYKFKFYDRKSC